jgi:hypothetical protein
MVFGNIVIVMLVMVTMALPNGDDDGKSDGDYVNDG